MSWQQHRHLSAKRRGFHLIDEEILRALPQIQDYQVGLLHLPPQHTSASLSINENADPTVRQDMEAHFNPGRSRAPTFIATPTKVMTICPRTLKPVL